ncbi:hypothetical protein Aduo_017822 [Ancylostoma duodenale]
MIQRVCPGLELVTSWKRLVERVSSAEEVYFLVPHRMAGLVFVRGSSGRQGDGQAHCAWSGAGVGRATSLLATLVSGTHRLYPEVSAEAINVTSGGDRSI